MITAINRPRSVLLLPPLVLTALPFVSLVFLASACGVPGGEPEDVEARASALVSMPTPAFTFTGCTGLGAYTGPGALNGVGCAFSPVLYGASFDGVDDRIETADKTAYHFTSAMTASAWVKPATTVGTQAIVDKWSSPDSYGLFLSNGSFQFKVAFPNGVYKIASAPATANAWSHVTGVYDGSKVSIYVNGALVASTTASGNMQSSSRAIEIGNWPASSPFKGVIDEVNLFGSALSAAQVAQLAGRNNSTSAPKTRKVLWIVYDPILSNGQRVHEKYGWWDPQSQIPDIMASLQVASGKYADYQIREINPANYFPPGVGGFHFTEATYDACLSSGGANCGPNAYDYATEFTNLGLCSRIQANDIDEVMIYGADYFGFDELAMRIPGDKVPYNYPTNGWLYPFRIHGLPDCGRTYFVMGYNYVVGVDNAIHSYGHRAETALALTVGRGYWDGCPGHPGTGPSDFDRYTCTNKDKTSTGINVAHVGSVHVPPNGLTDYDYGNTTVVTDASKSWVNYPFTTNTLTNENCTPWNCDQQGYMMWWLNHFPYKDGVTSNGNLQNWWKYIVDFDGALHELGK